MKSINKKILLISLILSLILSFLVYKYLKGLDDESEKVEYIEIYVASDDIDERQKITSNMIEKIKIIKDSYLTQSIQNPNEIIGLFSKEKILKGEVIPKERLFKEIERDLSLRVPDGQRAISIMANEMSGVADLIKPGDYVDVYVTLEEYKITYQSSETTYPKTSKLLLQKVLVLSISKEQNRVDTDRLEVPNAYPVTLSVSPIDGEKLILSEELGSLKLALRPLHDENIYDTEGTIRNDLSNEKGMVNIRK